MAWDDHTLRSNQTWRFPSSLRLTKSKAPRSTESTARDTLPTGHQTWLGNLRTK